MGQVYDFHSALPPEQLPDFLPDAWTACDQRAKLEVCIRTRWKGSRFTVTRTTVRRYTAADGWVPRDRARGVNWKRENGRTGSGTTLSADRSAPMAGAAAS